MIPSSLQFSRIFYGGRVVCELVLLHRRRRNIRRMPSNRMKMKAPKAAPIIADVGVVLVDEFAKPLVSDIGKRVEDPETPETVGETWTVWTEMEIPSLCVGTIPSELN